MGITTTQFIRKPLYVDAVRITGANFDEITTWCLGEAQSDEVPGKDTTKKYIKVRVHNPKNARQTKAFVGDWLLYTERGYKVYTNKAFHASFDEVRALEHEPEPSYPYDDGDTTVLGPECFVSQDGRVLCWRGINYVPQRSSRTISGGQPDDVIIGDEEIVPGITANEVVAAVRERAAYATEEIEIVPATAESIAQAVRDNEAARAEYPETHTVGGTPREEINVGVPTQPTNVDIVAEQETVEPVTAEGKRILSIAEQEELSSEEVRELVQSGEAILAQDIAAA